MPQYVAFLRAINLGRNRRLPMAALRSCLEESGLEDVETYIATGNVRFRSVIRARPRVERHLEDTIAAHCGFDVPAIVFTPPALREVYDDAVGLATPDDSPGVRRYVTLLKDDPPTTAAATLDGWDAAGEQATVIGRAVHWTVPGPSQAAKLSNARIERLLGVGTTRDLKVVTTLAERWGG